MTKGKHTEGPWTLLDDTSQSKLIHGPHNEAIASTGAANGARIVACVNGCDDAGVVEPGELKALMGVASEADCTVIAVGNAGTCGRCFECRIRAALRAVRGES